MSVIRLLPHPPVAREGGPDAAEARVLRAAGRAPQAHHAARRAARRHHSGGVPHGRGDAADRLPHGGGDHRPQVQPGAQGRPLHAEAAGAGWQVRGLWCAGLAVVCGATALGSPLEVPGTAGRVEAGGYLDGLAVPPTEGGPRGRPQALLALGFAAALSDRLRGHLALQSAIGGPFEGGHPGVYDLVHAFQNRPIHLEANEAYAELRLDQADVLAGVQKVAWGKLDGLPPTDVVNPRAYHDPLVRDVEEAKIGIPMLPTTGNPSDLPRLGVSGLRATLLYLPIAVPSRLPLIEERWFPPSATPLSQVVLPRKRAERLIEEACKLAVMLPGGVVGPVSFRTLNH